MLSKAEIVVTASDGASYVKAVDLPDSKGITDFRDEMFFQTTKRLDECLREMVFSRGMKDFTATIDVKFD